MYEGVRVAPMTPLQTGTLDFAKKGGFVWTPEQVGEYYRDVIKRPAEKEFSEDIIPAIREAYSGPGYWGSGRAESEVRARKDLSSDLQQRWGQLNWDVLEANKQGALAQFDLGSAEQQQRQNEILADMQKFVEENRLTDPENLAILLSFLGQNVIQVSTGSGESSSWDLGSWLRAGTSFLSGGSGGSGPVYSGGGYGGYGAPSVKNF